MPLYEYHCDACGQRFEIIQKFSDPAPDACRKCGKGPVHRLMSSPAFQFKGSGWYVTDYAKKDGGATTTGSSSSQSTESSSESSKGDAPKSDSAKSDSGTSSTSAKSESSSTSSTPASKT